MDIYVRGWNPADTDETRAVPERSPLNGETLLIGYWRLPYAEIVDYMATDNGKTVARVTFEHRKSLPMTMMFYTESLLVA